MEMKALMTAMLKKAPQVQKGKRFKAIFWRCFQDSKKSLSVQCCFESFSELSVLLLQKF